MENIVAKPVRLISWLVALLFITSAPTTSTYAGQQQAHGCTPSGPPIQLADLPEASGLAASRHASTRLWAHNDSGRPVLFALDRSGQVTGQVHLTGAMVEDWEAIAVGPCGTGSCVYVGDIGDNDANRGRVTIYRLREPENPTGTAAVSEVFHATYPDGAHDAETLLVAEGRLYIVTKGETGPIAMYRFPAELKAGATMRLERVGESSLPVDADSRITDGSVSPDGRWIVLRSRSALKFYRSSELLAGRWQVASSVDVRNLKEPQGEGIAFGLDGTIYLAGEGGGKGNAGTFTHVSCVLSGS